MRPYLFDGKRLVGGQGTPPPPRLALPLLFPSVKLPARVIDFGPRGRESKVAAFETVITSILETLSGVGEWGGRGQHPTLTGRRPCRYSSFHCHSPKRFDLLDTMDAAGQRRQRSSWSVSMMGQLD